MVAKRKMTFVILFIILSYSSIFADSSDTGGYMSLSAGTDLGWSIGVDGIKSNYVSSGLDFTCYIGRYFGLSYGAAVNAPFSVYYHNEKRDNTSSFIPIEIALRASVIGRYPLSDSASLCAKLGLSTSEGKSRYSANSYTGIGTAVSRMTERMDISLGIMSEISLSESFCLIFGADVLFPIYAIIRETAKDGSESKKASYEYRRYGVYPYIGFALVP